MKLLRDENGFAMAFVLILAAIALVLSLGMLLMVGTGSFVSGQQMRYSTAVEAARGGVESTLQVIASRGNPGGTYDNLGLVLDNGVGTKLVNATGAWGALNSSIAIDPDTPSTYDMQINLGAYRIYSKIVDTVEGNSGSDEGLEKGAVVNTGSGEVTVMSIPYLYTIEVLSQRRTNATERSKISVLYQY